MTQTTPPSKKGSGIVVDSVRARVVLDMLMADYVNHQKLFKYTHRVDAPQTVYRPTKMEVKSPEHARWLFFAAMTDRREISEMVYKGHQKLWGTHADLLYNNPLGSLSTEELKEVIQKGGFGMPTTAARDWQQCSATLFTRLEGDPCRIYEGRTINDIVRMKKNGWELSGFGPKILSLLAVFYTELGMITMPTDAFPVDVHVQRFALSTGILTIRKKTSNSHLERVLRPLLAGICNERAWSVVEVSHALWFLGNKLCTRCAWQSLAEVFCPARAMCGGPFGTKAYFKAGMWDHTTQSPVGSVRPFGLPNIEGGLFPQKSCAA